MRARVIQPQECVWVSGPLGLVSQRGSDLSASGRAYLLRGNWGAERRCKQKTPRKEELKPESAELIESLFCENLRPKNPSLGES